MGILSEMAAWRAGNADIADRAAAGRKSQPGGVKAARIVGRSGSVDLNEAADRLYGLAPDEFTATRDALVKEAKALGDVRLSRDIAKLRRPTVTAWAVNQASRRHPGELAELLDLGARLREAWHDQDAETLAELSRRRSAVTARLAGLISDNAEAQGRRLAALPEVEQTLDAAVVDADAAEQVRQGRLVAPLSYSGFAPAPTTGPRRTAAPPTARRKPAGGRPESEGEPGEERRRAEERERRARELEQAAAQADRTALEAAEAHAEWAAELAKAVRERDRHAKKVAQLADKLTAAQAKLAKAEKELDVAKRGEATARKSATTARRRADEAHAAIP